MKRSDADETAGPVISAWSAVSPWGLSSADFAEGLLSRRRTAGWLDPGASPTLLAEACLVPDFDIPAVLGPKGTRTMDRATALAVAAVERLLSPSDADTTGGAPATGRLRGVDESAGLTLGTSAGSVQSCMDFTRSSLLAERPYQVDPARFPNTVMNCAAGRAAIRNRLKGPNTTVAGGRSAGLLALRHALRIQQAGRVETILCGAVEEFSPARAWLEWHARRAAGRPDAESILGEGAAVWLLEPAGRAQAHGRSALASVAGIEFGFAADAYRIRPVLERCVRRLLGRTGARPEDLWAVAAPSSLGAVILGDLSSEDSWSEHRRPLSVDCAEFLGDTCAASAAFQIAAVLALARADRRSAGRLAIVASAEPAGVVGAALLRLH